MASRRPRSGPDRTVPSFAQWLRELPHTELVTLLRHRPDLCYPAPHTVTELATRASIEVSLARALEHLDAWLLAVVTALAAADNATPREAAWLLETEPDRVVPAVRALVERGLAWHPNGRESADDRVELLRGVRTHLGAYPGGLAPASTRPLTADRIRSLWDALGAAERRTADRLVWGQPTGAVRHAQQRGTGDTPIDRLLVAGILRPLGDDRVILPREVALWRRTPRRLTPEPVPERAPSAAVGTRAARLVDRAAVGTAMELIGDVEETAERLTAEPRRLLRDGSLSQRDVSALARALGVEPGRAGWLVDLAAAAGLLRRSTDQTLLATPAYDRWLEADPVARWTDLVSGWQRTERRFDHEAERRPLDPEQRSAAAADLRAVIADVLDAAGPGARLDRSALTQAAAWHRPGLARSGLLEPLTDEVWHDAANLGLTALGCVTSAGGHWAADELAAAVGAEFPATSAQVTILSDLTAIAPGPLTPDAAAALRLLADAESRGAARVFRFTATSLRRAFEAGWSADQIVDWLADHAPDLPQPLHYLIGDVARQYGSVRVGLAGSYIRTGDEAHAAAVLRHPEAATLGIRRLGPGILVAQADPDEVARLLRDMQLAPAVEDSEGHLRTAPPVRRARHDSARQEQGLPPVDPAAIAAAVLAGERRQAALAAATGGVLEQLAEAQRRSRPIRLAYVADDGTPQVRTVVPVGLSAGQVRVLDGDHRFSLPLARISAAGPPTD